MTHVSKRHVIEEVMSLLPCGWQQAKKIVELAALPADEFRTVQKRRMSSQEAGRIVTRARERIALVDE